MTDSFEATRPDERRASPFASEPRTHVLIVDDDRAARRVCAGYCDLFDFTFATAKTAAEAGEALNRERFDVMLVNVHMEGCGVEGVRALPPLPVIGLTAIGRGDEAQRWLAAGLAGVLPKPVTAARLFAALTAAVSARPDQSRSWAPA